MILRAWNSAHLLLVLAALFWAGHTVALRLSVGEISPVLLMALRWLGSVVILVLVFRGSILEHLPQIKARWRYIMAMGGLGLASFSILLVNAAHYTTAMNLGITQGAIPAFVMLFGLLFYRTQVSAMQLLGFVISFGGVVVLVSAGSFENLRALQISLGDLLMIAACLCYAGYAVGLAKKLDMPPVMMLICFAFGAFVTCSIFSIAEYAQGGMILPSINGMLLVAYSAIFPSILSQTFFIRGVELAGANRAGLYVNLVPVFAAFLAVMILSEAIYFYHVVALLAVLGGIYLAEQGKLKS